jgi:CubicO group peptidase (beta-lactamase class C family)
VIHLALSLASAAATAVAAVPAPSPAEAALSARLDRVIETAVAEQRIVGTVVLVARNGDVVYHRAAGYADREAQRPMREDAVFRLASITKPIVAIAAMRLVERGRLHLDDSVTAWLPWFEPRLADGRAPAIAIRHLLAHTAGLSYTFEEPANSAYHRLGISDGLDESRLTLEENLRRLAAVPLRDVPGAHWHYSLAYDVLGAVVARANGTTLQLAVRDLVTAPLGMRDTAFLAAAPARLAVPYADGRPRPVRMSEGMQVALPPAIGYAVRFAPSRAMDPKTYPSGGAGMVGTAADVLRLLEAIRSEGKPLLDEATFAQMSANQVGADAQTQGPGWGFGYGWAVLVDPVLAKTPQARGTLQWGGVYGHSWFVDRASGLSVVALTNTAFEGMSGAFPGEIRDAVYGAR